MYTLVLECDPAVRHLYEQLHPNEENAGVDMYAMNDVSDESSTYLSTTEVDTTLCKEYLQYVSLGAKAVLLRNGQPVNYWLVPRSSFSKTGFVMANSVGVIDKSYRGVLKAPVRYLQEGTGIQKDNRYFQIVAPDMGPISDIRIVDSIDVYASKRGANGFGSSGTA